MIFQSIFERYYPESEFLSLLSSTQRFFSTRNCFIVEKLWLFGPFSGDKGDNIDMWMIKITIKANEIDMDVFLISQK